jgi:chaperone required for assembly of F1-ATPase
MKRFWDTAATEATEGGFRVLLDGRPVRLPGGAPLLVAARPLAEAIAEEWRAAGGPKGGEMSQGDVPLTRLAGTAQEKLAADPTPMVDGLAKYGETDLLCFRAEDRRLAEREAREWQPLLDWAALALDASLRVTTGVMAVPQPPDALAALRRALAAEDAVGLAALGLLVPAFGSVVLGLAVLRGRLSGEAAFRLSILGETFQEEFWGTDPEAERRRARVAADVALAERLLHLTRGRPA